MNYFFITGTSSGIGQALAKLLLTDKNNIVTGISRSVTITSENYRHIKLDLNDIESVSKFDFGELKDPEIICLINNSAHFSESKHYGNADTRDIIKNYNVNNISPGIMINKFLSLYQSYNCKRIIISISSGAAVTAIESWSNYCSSKAALLMLSKVIALEQSLKYPSDPVKIYSVSPGDVDTPAQERIRNTSPENFSMVGKFIEFHEKKQLSDPVIVAEKIAKIIFNTDNFTNTEIHVNDIQI